MSTFSAILGEVTDDGLFMATSHLVGGKLETRISVPSVRPTTQDANKKTAQKAASMHWRAGHQLPPMSLANGNGKVTDEPFDPAGSFVRQTVRSAPQ
jgi:hypothetical protein